MHLLSPDEELGGPVGCLLRSAEAGREALVELRRSSCKLGEAVVATAGVARPEVLLLVLRGLVLALHGQTGGRARVDRLGAELRDRHALTCGGEAHVLCRC